MRPLKLKMQAFGPYAKTEWIDFNELGNRTMFVIAGETGAGKTTIFDAISYAIYGVASGDERLTDDLRSHLAEPDLLTEVEFQFSLHDKIYKIIRSPKQLRKKVKKEGYTEINSKAELFVLNEGDWELLAYQLNDVDQTMRQIIGLDKEQFRQILMIPQGEFRKLLVSDSKEKEKILQKLFSTHMYSKIEETLKKKSNELSENIKELQKDQNKYFSMVHAIFNEQLKNYLADGTLEYHLMMPLLEEETKKQLEGTEILSKELKLKEESLALVNKKHALSTELVKKFDLVHLLQEEYHELQKQKDEINNKIQLVKSIEKAQILQPEEELGRNLNKTYSRIDSNLDDKNKELEVSNKEMLALTNQLEHQLTNKNDIEQKNKQLQKLLILKNEVKNLQQLQEDVKQLEKVMIENQQKQSTLQKKELELKQVLEQLELQINEIQTKKNIYYQLDLQVKEDKKQLELLMNLSKLQLEKQATEQLLTQLKNDLNVHETKLNDVKEAYEQYERNRMHSQAALLASHLKSGDVCPVCGSLDHPKLATASKDVFNEEELDYLKKQKEAAELEYTKLANQISNEEWKITYYQQQLEEQLSPLNISINELSKKIENDQKETKNKEEQLNQLKQIISNEEQYRSTKTNVKSQMVQVENALQQLQPILQQTFVQHQLKTEQIQALLEKLPENIQSFTQFTNVVNQLDKEISIYTSQLEDIQEALQKEKEKNARLLEAIYQMTKELEEAKLNLGQQRQLFKRKMEESGFANKEDYLKTVELIKEKDNIKQSIEAYQMHLQSVTVRLKDLEEELKNKEKPDITQLEMEISQLQLEIKDMQNEYMKLTQFISTNKLYGEKIKKIRQDLIKIEKEYTIIGELSDIASGKNPFKISFERYVLGYFLDRILVEANIRLNKMTNGRYELIRKTDLNKSRGAAGLDLLIIDQYSGRQRHVRTLSGGESFKASLALALGLSDVVTQNAGGISMETIFIDEGFGTLDNESLNQAIDTLMEIQSSGRLVGIISHVDQLKENIDARLEVLSSTSGSYTRFVFSTTT